MHVTSEHIAHLSGDVLLALARNEAAQMRKAAVEIMLEKGYKQVNHPEIAGMVAEVRKEREAKLEVESIVESAIESELPNAPKTTGCSINGAFTIVDSSTQVPPSTYVGPFTASVTTANMQEPTIIHNGSDDRTYFEIKDISEPVEETGTQKLNAWIRRVEAGDPIVVTNPSEEQQKSDFIEQNFPSNPLETTQADELPQASD